MKNKLSDLNDHLFAQLERLSDETLSDDQRDAEIKRAASMVPVSDQILKVAGMRLAGLHRRANHECDRA